MKRVYSFITFSISLLIVLSGCKKTPDSVVQREIKVLGEKETISELLQNTPSNIEEIIEGSQGTLTINAKVILPNTDAFPLLSISYDAMEDDEAICSFFWADQNEKTVNSNRTKTKEGKDFINIVYKNKDSLVVINRSNSYFGMLKDINHYDIGNLSPDQAVEKATLLCNDIGIETTPVLVIKEEGEEGSYYDIFFEYLFFNIPVEFTQYPLTTSYNNIVTPPKVEVKIDSNGIFYFIADSYVISEILEEDVKLLSLQDAISTLQNNIEILCTEQSEITDISLKYLPIPSDNPFTYQCVPVWFFSNGENINTNLYYNVWINALTGEIMN